MDELIALLLVGWIGSLTSSTSSKKAKTLSAIWGLILIGGVGLVIWAIIATDSGDNGSKSNYSPTEQSFIDLCKQRDGTPSRDIDDPSKMICL